LFTTRRGRIKNIQGKERPNVTVLGRESNKKISIVFFQNENLVDGFYHIPIKFIPCSSISGWVEISLIYAKINLKTDTT